MKSTLGRSEKTGMKTRDETIVIRKHFNNNLDYPELLRLIGVRITKGTDSPELYMAYSTSIYSNIKLNYPILEKLLNHIF